MSARAVYRTVHARIAVCLATLLIAAVAAQPASAQRRRPPPQPTPAPAPVPAPASHKGMNVNEVYEQSGAALAATIARYQALGIKWVRFDFDWSIIQPSRSGYFFDRHVAAVRALTAAGINVLGIIDYTPGWANGGKPSKFYPPQKPSDYAAFAATLARQFGPLGVHTWEIWNEPNLDEFWKPAPNAAAYATLLKAAYTAIKSADPKAVVLTGGLAAVGNSATTVHPVDFVTSLYKNGARGYFDAIAHHPYDFTFPAEGWSWRLMSASSPSIRSVMTANGDAAKQIWITEIGVPTAGSASWARAVSEATQGDILAQAYALVRTYNWAGPLFWYNFQDWCVYGTSQDIQCFFGIHRADGSRKPAAERYRVASD
jgi:hypothetical protein